MEKKMRRESKKYMKIIIKNILNLQFRQLTSVCPATDEIFHRKTQVLHVILTDKASIAI